MSTLENASAVLKLLSSQPIMHGQPSVSFSNVVEYLGLPKSTTSRLLQKMEEEGFLEREPDSRLYRVGSVLLSVASHYLSTPLVDSIAGNMVQLCQLTHCTGYLSVLKNKDIMVMRMFPGLRSLQVVTPAGSLSPAAETSVGRAILARESDENVVERFIDGYQVGSQNSPQTLDALLEKLAQIRKQGWSLARNETLQGISSLATTVKNKYSSETVGLCLSFPTQTVEQPFSVSVLDALMLVSQQIAEKLGDDYWQHIKVAHS